MRNTFIVPRVQGTYADALTALGLAGLLQAVEAEGEGRILIKFDEAQDVYLVTTRTDVGDVSQHPSRQLFEYIKTASDTTAPAETFDYEEQKKRRQQAFEWKKKNPRTKWDQVPEGIEEPRPDYSLYSSLVDLLKPINSSGYATAHKELHSERFGVHAEAALQAFGSQGDPVELIERDLKKRFKGARAVTQVSVVQAFNPMTGKGMNAPKANSIGMGQEKAPVILEGLKFAGWFTGAVAVTPQGNKDLKVLVVHPAEMTLADLRSVMADFRKNFPGGGAIQLDILAALTLTEALLHHHEHRPFRRGRPRDILHGFATAYFQNLGSAKGVTNIAFIALPGWVHLPSGAEAGQAGRNTWLDVLKEHKKVIRRLDESHSEERSLLEQYRDFLSGQDVRAFLGFLSDYGPHALRLKYRDDPQRPPIWMTTEGIGRVIKNMDQQNKNNRNAAEVIENRGFQNVAKAIRGATRGALNARKPFAVKNKPPRQPDRSYEVRYGLAQELKRAAVTKERFLAALGEFISDYNAENLRVSERRRDRATQGQPEHPNPQRRIDVSTEDLLELTKLLDRHDPQMVAMLLIAYGYAKAPNDSTGEPEGPSDTDDHDLSTPEENT